MNPNRTRLYVVAATDSGAERLIRAENKHKAVFLASVARIATQTDLERLFALGVVPESREGLDPLEDLELRRVNGHADRIARKPKPKTKTTNLRSPRNV
jgi:hypothetical protein